MELSHGFFDVLADAARAEFGRSEEHRADFESKVEGGFDPVTQVDRAIEQRLRRLISDAFPDDGICGEEFGCRGDSRVSKVGALQKYGQTKQPHRFAPNSL